MKTIVLISCVSKKRRVRSKAEDLYISPLFRLNLAYAKSLKPDGIYILSAEHGVLALDAEVDPYDKTLNNMPARERRAWGDKAASELGACSNPEADRFVFLAGAKYREFITPHLTRWEAPMKALGIGKQLQFLKGQTDG